MVPVIAAVCKIGFLRRVVVESLYSQSWAAVLCIVGGVAASSDSSVAASPDSTSWIAVASVKSR